MPRPDFPRTVLEFQKRFATEDACLEYLIASCWPEGFVCRRCGSTDAWWKSPRRLFECKTCRYQASVTAGTVMHRSRMPLRLWFWTAHLVTTHTPGLSALQFARQLDLHYETAFHMLHKLRAAMVREGRERLRGTVEVDEAYIGGARCGKGGRGAYGKVLVAGAVEVRGQKMGRIRLGVIRGASTDQLLGFVKAMVEEGSTVITDAWKGYASLGRGGYQHEAQLEGTPERAPRSEEHTSELQSPYDLVCRLLL